MLISVVIPTHNRADALDLTLQYLSRQQFSGSWEVIVVDNNSTDDTFKVVEKWKAIFPVQLEYMLQVKPGPAATRNVGGKKASGEYLIFIDNDILTEPDFVQRHYNNLLQYPGSWFVGHIENMPEQKQTHFGKFRESLYTPPSKHLIETGGITGQSTSMQRAQFLELGGFDENFHVASGEDRELALRAIKKGIKIYSDSSIVVLHNDWAGSSIKDYCNRQRLYTLTEPFFWQKYGNETPRIKMVKENLPPSLKRDGIKLFAWKNLKRVFGSRIGQATLVGMAGFFEIIFPKPVILWKLYKMAISGAIYKGFNEGLKIFEVDTKTLANTLINVKKNAS